MNRLLLLFIASSDILDLVSANLPCYICWDNGAHNSTKPHAKIPLPAFAGGGYATCAMIQKAGQDDRIIPDNDCGLLNDESLRIACGCTNALNATNSTPILSEQAPALHTARPSRVPSMAPSKKKPKATPIPSRTPSSTPSTAPSTSPSSIPSQFPSSAPLPFPTNAPSQFPSSTPLRAPTQKMAKETPTFRADSIPSQSTILSDAPSGVPSDIPSSMPRDVQSSTPSGTLSSTSTDAPSSSPTQLRKHIDPPKDQLAILSVIQAFIKWLLH